MGEGEREGGGEEEEEREEAFTCILLWSEYILMNYVYQCRLYLPLN